MTDVKFVPMEVSYVDHMGSDLSVVNAARVSFDKVSEWAPSGSRNDYEGVIYQTAQGRPVNLKQADAKLIRYLAKHNHWSPLAHTSVSIRVKAPIFMARQFVKHQIGLVWNEESRRYIDDTPEFYEPDTWRIRPEGSIKQGSGTTKLPAPEFVKGFCPVCGKETTQNVRAQGGGRVKKYCSDVCKYHYTNRNRNPYKACFSNAEARVKREGKREWSLDFDTFDFPEYCPYLGIKLDYSLGKGKIQPDSPSFDRIDSAKDYIHGNVEIISNRANSMKSDASREEQIKMAEHVLLKYKGCVPSKSNTYEGLIESAKDLYENMIQDGYSPEQARMILPQNTMTNWIWTGSIMAFARVCKLRLDGHAQVEAQELAKLIEETVAPLYPVSWKCLMEHLKV